MTSHALIQMIRQSAIPLSSSSAYESIQALIGEAHIVLLGEATHGSHDFYQIRAKITQQLIEEKAFDAIVVEADWPDALRVSRYVQGAGDKSALDALSGFNRFPRWMWRNEQIVHLIKWLRVHNQQQTKPPVGFFGLDLYSLHASIDAILGYLTQHDKEGVLRARERYACFDHFTDLQQYGYDVKMGVHEGCQREVVLQLMEMLTNIDRHFYRDGSAAADELFYAQQNAKVVQNAEAYYRAIFDGGVNAWNLRDTHMADTLEALQNHLSWQLGRPAKLIVWAHNSHIGDARATAMRERGELNLGQLVRERPAFESSFLLGFTTHTGRVTAASMWGGPGEQKTIQPSHSASYERLFHDTDLNAFFLPLNESGKLREALIQPRLERAIGVIYRPETERLSHYFYAALPEQFDAVIHIDQTLALRPLDRLSASPHQDELDTYPSGM